MQRASSPHASPLNTPLFEENGANEDGVEPMARCVSTSNRNFVGRQGPLARTHIASPSMAAAAGIAGEIADVRRLLE